VCQDRGVSHSARPPRRDRGGAQRGGPRRPGAGGGEGARDHADHGRRRGAVRRPRRGARAAGLVLADGYPGLARRPGDARGGGMSAAERGAGPAPGRTLGQLAQWAGGDLVVREVPADAAAREALLRTVVHGATLDTREIRPGMLFVPLPGSRTDGHAFLDEAFERGAAAALCARAVHPRVEGLSLGPLVLVDDVTAALQKLATRVRERWAGWVIAVTGSAGKTTTKELVSAV